MVQKSIFALDKLFNSTLFMLQKLTLFAVLALVFSSCSKDKLDFSMAEDIKFRPKVEASLVNAHLSLKDLAEQDSNLVVDANEALWIRYRQEDLFQFNAIDFVDIPEQEPTSIPLSKGLPQINSDLELGTMGGVELGSASFYAGYFSIGLETSIPFTTDVDVKVILKNAKENGITIERILTLPVGSLSVKDSIDISSAVFDFTDGQQKVNYIGLSVEMLNASSVVLMHDVNVVTQFKNLELENADGFFGQRSIKMPSGDFDFDISGVSDFVNGLYLTEPSVRLITTSTIGASLGLSLDLDGVNEEGNVVSLDANPELLAAATSTTSPAKSIIEYNVGNSQVADFLANIPSTILFSGSAEINPPGESRNNFISRNSSVSADLEVDVPLKFKADNVKLDQTLDVDFFEENPEEVENLSMIFYVDNGLPFDVDVNVMFLESATGDSLQGFNIGSLLSAAPVNAEGRVTEHAPSQRIEREFTAQMLSDLQKCNKIRFVAKLSTADNGAQEAALYSDYELNIKVAAKIKLNLNL